MAANSVRRRQGSRESEPATPPPRRRRARRRLTVRAGLGADADAIELLEQVCFDRDEEKFNKRQIRSLLANANAMVRVAVQGDQIVGWAVGLRRVVRTPRTGERKRIGRLYAVAVSPTQRGRGIGRLLAEHVVSELDAEGAQRVVLEVRETNLTAIALYESMGFTMARRLANYYGQDVHALRLVRDIPTEHTWRGSASDDSVRAPSASSGSA